MRSVQPRRPAESAVETTHLVLPPDTNAHGTMFGGRLMQWMDIAAGIAAGRHCGGDVVTVAVDELVFERPICIADVVIIKASVNHTGRSSMEVGVRVEREEPATGVHEHCLTGYFTFVAIDKNSRPIPVAQIIAETNDEKRRFENAAKRRERRLASRA
jgi:acyl-CoA hydrolase